MENNSTGDFFCRANNYPAGFWIYGVICPIISAFTLIFNMLVIVVFLKRKMRSPTSALLIGLAVSDILAANVINISFVYVHGFLDVTKPLPYPMCIIYNVTAKLAPSFHTTSVWITTALGIQRFIIVAFPMQGPRFCSIRTSTVIIVSTYVLSFLMYIPSFLQRRFDPVTILDESGNEITVCNCTRGQEILQINKLQNVLRSVFGQLVPCAILFLTTLLLSRKLKLETKRILQLHKHENTETERRDFRQIRRTSQMIIVLVSIFLFVEIPNGIVFALFVFYPELLESNIEQIQILSIVLNLLVFIIYLINFWIYVTLSRQFRRELKLLCGRKLCGYREKINIGMSTTFTSIPMT
ncbi:sex peptide receptor-like [Mytilus galloprovincialis]|uniref:G-protein coupled receptors family 1 profile domain-containing protein n=1 Tax=Mytilus galloprovincialis TaxID=29158 RepID=A0A8B6CIF7_MYTGA|nr:Hypothetical predicted protein [Mytilus galloprovincialis]